MGCWCGIGTPPGPMLALRGAGLGAPPGADMIVFVQSQYILFAQLELQGKAIQNRQATESDGSGS